MITYIIEVKNSDRTSAKMGKYGIPGRIWVRGYNEQGERVEQYHVDFVDLRYTGPRSHYAQVYSNAQTLISNLTKKVGA